MTSAIGMHSLLNIVREKNHSLQSFKLKKTLLFNNCKKKFPQTRKKTHKKTKQNITKKKKKTTTKQNNDQKESVY